MLQNKKVNAIIAIVAAILVWAFVVGMVDPGVTKRFTDVPVQLINQDSLTQDGLAVDSTDITSINVTLSGDRADINKLEEGDIQVTADLYGRHEGSNYVSLEVQLPRGISLDSRSEDRILINIGQLVTAEKSVEATLTGEVAADTEMSGAKVEPETMTIYGTKKNVDKVDRIEAAVNAKLLNDKDSTHDVAVKTVDSSGKEVPYVTTSQETASVTARLVKYKEVPLKVDTTGSVAQGYELESVKAPDTVRIEGSADILADITSVTADDIDISGLTENTRVKINLNLPDGVSVRNSDELYATVNVRGPSTGEFSFSGNEIAIEGLDEGLSASISGSIRVSVSGPRSAVSALTKADITVSVNLSGLGEGTHEVPVYVTSSADSGELVLEPSPGTVEVTVTQN
ncbi:MAG TPA: hypothetical protein IAA36_01280 [Candidatus Eubacterium pullicola]|nr:hypothetical protein [Candidatus Eubacterium pullicola]